MGVKLTNSIRKPGRLTAGELTEYPVYNIPMGNELTMTHLIV